MTDLVLHIKGIEDVDCTLDFYVERDRALTFKKSGLTKRLRNNTIEYYVVLDADSLGRGNIICRVVFKDEHGKDVVVSGFTGYSIPCCGEGRTISCGDYSVSFEGVEFIPNGDAFMYVGVTRAVIGNITADDIKGLWSVRPMVLKTDADFNAGDSIVVAIPEGVSLKAMKDNGFMEPVGFDYNVMGFNGDKVVDVDGIPYMIYGEFMVVDGALRIYIQ